MVRQTAISARIYNETLWRIEQKTMLGYETRNGILNKGARLYLSLDDARRAARTHQDPDTRKKILEGFLRQWFPEALGFKDQ